MKSRWEKTLLVVEVCLGVLDASGKQCLEEASDQPEWMESAQKPHASDRELVCAVLDGEMVDAGLLPQQISEYNEEGYLLDDCFILVKVLWTGLTSDS